MADTRHFQFLAESARRFVGLLAARHAFELKDGTRGSALVRHIDRTASGFQVRIGEVENEYRIAENDIDRDEAVKQMRLLNGYAHFMRRALPWLEDAKNPPLDLGALYFIDRLSVALVGERADVVPTRADEYSTEQRPFEPLFPQLKLSPERGTRPIILNFPALEAGSFPLLPLFAHELGHTAVVKGSLVAKSLDRARAKSDFVDATGEATDALASQMLLKKKRSRLIIDERMEDWITELLCDQLALQYLGPSFLLAFAAYLVPLSWNVPGPRHPPTTVRIAHLLAWIENTHWEVLLLQRMPYTFAWLKQVANAPRPLGLATALSSLLDAINLVRQDVSSTCNEYLGSNVFNANTYLANAKHLDDLLRHEILPVQHPRTGEAFEDRAILTAGWLSMHEEATNETSMDSPTVLCQVLSQTKSNSFFTKALEMSSVLNTWDELA